MSPRRGVRVLVVGDDPLSRSGIAGLLTGHPGLAVAGQASPAGGFEAAHVEADVAVFDAGLGPIPSLDAIGAIALPVLAIVGDEGRAADALASGARGVLLRDAAPERLGVAVQAVAAGLVVLDESVAASLKPRVAAGEPLVEPLTPREIDVLELLARGLANKAIAERLGISDHTVKFHVNAILGKLGAESRTDAIVRAARLGLVVL